MEYLSLGERYSNAALQPVLLVAGEQAGSLWHTEKLDKLIRSAKDKSAVVDTAHMDFYVNEKYVGPAREDVTGFIKEHLA